VSALAASVANCAGHFSISQVWPKIPGCRCREPILKLIARQDALVDRIEALDETGRKIVLCTLLLDVAQLARLEALVARQEADIAELGRQL
jgi:hypothetical protein